MARSMNAYHYQYFVNTKKEKVYHFQGLKMSNPLALRRSHILLDAPPIQSWLKVGQLDQQAHIDLKRFFSLVLVLTLLRWSYYIVEVVK